MLKKTESRCCDLDSYSCIVIVEMKRWFLGFSFIVANVNGTG